MLVEGRSAYDPTGAWEYPPPTDLSPQTLDWDTWQGTYPSGLDPLDLRALALLEGIWDRRGRDLLCIW